jgi:glycosyltransferase involved in cell wall biosynthesis
VPPHLDPHRPLLVCFSHLRWDFVYQRPQHLMTRAAGAWNVLFVEEPSFEAVARPELRLLPVGDALVRAVPVLPQGLAPIQAVQAQRALLEPHLERAGSGPRVHWFYTPMALPIARGFDADVRVYDNMDELSAFKNAPAALLALEDELLRHCELVFTGGRSLYEAKRDRHRNIHAFPSSVDTAHFGRARSGGDDPAEQASLAHPRLGFFGVIDERFDAELVAGIADLRPQWQLVMLGPVAKIDPASLPQRPNLHWLGMQRYDALPAFLAHWDVGLMPFAINDATRYISPTKTPEFLAAGVPVVSTPIRDVVRPYGERGLVEIASDAPGFVAHAEMLLSRPRAAWLAAVDEQLARSSWDSTWAAMQALIETEIAQAAARRTDRSNPLTAVARP